MSDNDKTQASAQNPQSLADIKKALKDKLGEIRAQEQRARAEKQAARKERFGWLPEGTRVLCFGSKHNNYNGKTGVIVDSTRAGTCFVRWDGGSKIVQEYYRCFKALPAGADGEQTQVQVDVAVDSK